MRLAKDSQEKKKTVQKRTNLYATFSFFTPSICALFIFLKPSLLDLFIFPAFILSKFGVFHWPYLSRQVYITPSRFYKLIPKRLMLIRWNCVSFISHPIDTLKGKFGSMTLLLHMMTSSRKMTVQILRSNPCWSRKHEMPIKSCLSKIFTWNFHTILVIR